MSSRRKFLLHGSMASAALIAAKPFEAIAKAGARIPGTVTGNNNITFLHTAKIPVSNFHLNQSHIAALKYNSHNLTLLNASTANDTAALPYDACINDINNNVLAENKYKIIYKGNIKIGVITANAGETDILQKINDLAAFLKKEKKCDLVACISQLGYKNTNRIDDLSLAQASLNLDMIFSADSKNYSANPYIALNKNKEEVIINYTAGYELALRKIEITFNAKREKNHIAFTPGVT